MRKIALYVTLMAVVGLLAYLIADAPGIASRISYSVAKARSDAIRDSLPELSRHDYMSALFAQVAESITPSVVEIRVSKRVPAENSDIEEFIRRFREQSADEPDRPGPGGLRYQLQRGLGSGVVVDAANGYILTNNHVVAGADQIEITLWTGRTVDVEWVRYDPPTDLALIKVRNLNAPAVVLGDSDGVQVGDWVLAVGAPEGLSQSVTAGIISARDRSTCDINSCRSFLQTDAAINRGNSGGPLVNLRGKVVGIATAIISSSGGSDGIGLAIPSNVARRVMAELIEKGTVTRGHIGVSVQDVTTELVRALDLPSRDGALVTWVTEGGPAHEAELAPGDFIVSVQGLPIDRVATLRERVGRIAPGSEARVEFFRKGERREVTVTVAEQPQPTSRSAPIPPPPARDETFGLRVATPNARLARLFGYHSPPRGVLITSVIGGSEADRHRLRPGMIIAQVRDRRIATAEDFRRAVSDQSDDGGAVTMLIIDSAGQARFVVLTS